MIIREAKEMLKCERCTVFLLDLKMYDQVQKVNQKYENCATKQNLKKNKHLSMHCIERNIAAATKMQIKMANLNPHRST